jgi:ATP-dependent Clp protease ATP-binding subunit ClpB
MNLEKFTLKAREAIQAALDIASGNNHQAVEPVHLLLALLSDPENVVNTILNKIGISLPKLKNELEQSIQQLPVVKGASVSGQYLSNKTKGLFDAAQKAADDLGDEYISSEHVLIGILGTKNDAAKLLKDQGIKKDDVLKILQEVRGSQKVDDPNAESRYNALKKYARDLNEQAEKTNWILSSGVIRKSAE